jgi:hypothetical protein
MPLDTSIVSRGALSIIEFSLMLHVQHWHGISQPKIQLGRRCRLCHTVPDSPRRSFCVNFTHLVKLAHTGITRIHSTQYCDGLRGPLVIYDPADPLAHMYDVDDGKLAVNFYVPPSNSHRKHCYNAFGLVRNYLSSREFTAELVLGTTHLLYSSVQSLDR